MESKKDYFLLFIKGAIMGIANVIPGVSGGTLAVSLNIYELLINTISNFFKDFKKSIKILFPLGFGILAGILATSKAVIYAIDKYQAQTIFLFVGLILGGLSILTRKIKKEVKPGNIAIFVIVFLLVIGINAVTPTISNVTFTNMHFINYLLLFGVGALASSAMVIPGISGSFILMLIGYYEPIFKIISDITNISHIGYNLSILVPFGLGALTGILLIAKLIDFLLKKNEIKTYYAIIGFVLSSIVILIMQIKPFTYNFVNIFTCILTFLWGYLLAKNIEKE